MKLEPMTKLKFCYTFLLIFLLPVTAFAKTEVVSSAATTSNLAQYSSDVAECQQTEKAENICLYSGSASFIRGDEKLRAQKIAVYKDVNNQIYQIIAFGDKPGDRAYYDTLYAPDEKNNDKPDSAPQDKKPVNAVANVIKLFHPKNTALFIGNARITRDHDNVTGSYIEYDIKKQTMLSRPDIGQQTTIVLYPKQKQ